MNEILKKRIENIPYRITRVGNGANDAYNEGVRHGAEWMLSHMWISVEEALPENQDYVLAEYKGSIFMAWYRKRNNMWHNIYGIEMDVDRWMPIPKIGTKDNE